MFRQVVGSDCFRRRGDRFRRFFGFGTERKTGKSENLRQPFGNFIFAHTFDFGKKASPLSRIGNQMFLQSKPDIFFKLIFEHLAVASFEGNFADFQ